MLPDGVGVVQYRGIPPPPGSGYASSQVVTMERVSGTWSAESLVREYPLSSQVSPGEGALGARSSPDGSRRVVWVVDSFLRLYFRDGSQAWTEVWPGMSTLVLGAWSSGDGKFAFLVKGNVELWEP